MDRLSFDLWDQQLEIASLVANLVEQRVEKDTMETVKVAGAKTAWLGRLLNGAKGMIAAGEIERWMVAEMMTAMIVEMEV